MRLLAVAAALLVLSGCLSFTSTSTTTTVQTYTFGPGSPSDRLVEPTLLPQVLLGPGVGEPNIAVGPDGTIYAADPGINVWRSNDGGRSFAKTSATGIEGGGDGDIVVDDTGRLHWLGLFGASGPIPYQFSDDRGATFSAPLDLSNGTGSDREWLAGRPEGTLYASWRGSDPDGVGVIHTTTSFDRGATWSNLTVMAADAVGGPIVAGPVAGQVYEAMTTFGDAAESPGGVVATSGAAILLARSSDHGFTWELRTIFHPPQSAQLGLIGFPTSIFPVVAADEAGTLYVVFSTDQRVVSGLPSDLPKSVARFGVYLTSSQDQGETWTAPVLLSDPDHNALMPFIAAGAAGRAAVVWYENTAGLPSDFLPDLWNVKLWESITADEAEPEGITVQLNDLPNHIGAVCTAGTGCLAGDRSLLDFFEVALKPDGHPVAVWAYTVVGTGVGVSAVGPDVYVGGVADGTPLA